MTTHEDRPSGDTSGDIDTISDQGLIETEVDLTDTTGDSNLLLGGDATDDFRTRWESIQSTFVDDPRAAVTGADSLVEEVMDRLKQTFEDQRSELESGWTADASDDAGSGADSTEDLRVAFRRYRSFFERLLRT